MKKDKDQVLKIMSFEPLNFQSFRIIFFLKYSLYDTSPMTATITAPIAKDADIIIVYSELFDS
jgi:hypothetical protein